MNPLEDNSPPTDKPIDSGSDAGTPGNFVHDLIERTHRIQRERPHSLAVDSL